jgi:asparaginyl-tRNA synthetase
VYTFGPTFRAENSHTTRHLAEFWMVEPEMAFYDLKDTVELAEALLKYLIQFALEHCPDDLDFLHQRALTAVPKHKETEHILPLLERLELVIAQPFERITYTEAITILKASRPNKKGRFIYPIQHWGDDLQSEHERYLTEQHFKQSVVITDYPSTTKAFYMRQNEDGKTVAAMDILFPGVGEIAGGSQREERLDRLLARMQQMKVDARCLQWYLDTRRFGSVPHSGFGLGLDRFVQFVTGMENIRDVIPFPRTPGNASF